MIHYTTSIIRDGVDVVVTVTGALVRGSRGRCDPVRGIYEQPEPSSIEEMEAVDPSGKTVDLTEDERERIEMAMLDAMSERSDP